MQIRTILEKKFIGADDLRKDLSTILNRLPKEKKFVITQHGQPKGVLIDIDSYLEYEELLDQIADSDPKLIKRVNSALEDVKKNGGIPMEEAFKQLSI